MHAPFEAGPARAVLPLYGLSLGGLALCLATATLPLVSDISYDGALAVALPMAAVALLLNAASIRAMLKSCSAAATALERSVGAEAGRGGATLQRLASAVRSVDAAMTAHEQEVERLNHADPLTGLGNRRWLQLVASRSFAAAKAAGTPVCALMLRIDHLQEINRRDGYDAGDRALLSCADMLRRLIRRGDSLARVSGNEFVVLLPGAPRDAADGVARRIGETVARMPQAVLGEATLAIRLSVAAWDGETLIEPLLARAQAAIDAQPPAGILPPQPHAWGNPRLVQQDLALIGVRPPDGDPPPPRRRRR